MIRHAVDIDFVHERASATPGDLGAKPLRPPVPAPVSPDATLSGVPEERTHDSLVGDLRHRQLWFARAIMTPESETAAISDDEASRELLHGPRLRALDRLEIYRRSYHARLVECLADDYPVLEEALGHSAFEELCRAYIARHPSEGPNLNFFGRHMERFCREGAPSQFPLAPLAADLASLEWAIVEVIHAPSSPPLTIEGLRDVPMEAWAGARLIPNTAFRLLSFDYPVNAYFQAVREGEHPERPTQQPSATVVYRSGPTVWRMDLTVPMFAVLSALVGGETLEESLSRAETSVGAIGEQQAAERVLGWFRDWVGSGIFARIELR